MKKLIYLHGQKEDPCVTHIDFPTGEKHIRIKNLTATDEVILFYNDPAGDVMKLGMAVDICRRANVSSITLIIPFVPYARQDRVAVEGDPFSIRVFAAFVNSLGFDKVVITDPHSEVTPALIDNVVIIPQHEVAFHAVMQLDEHLSDSVALVAPDLGAAKKIKALQSYLFEKSGLNFPIIQCDKTRDPKTGKITGFKILDGVKYAPNHHCLMVDDIADGAASMIGLAKIIREAGANNQSLYITHAIMNRGTEHVLEVFDHIYASNSFPRQSGITVI